VNTTTDEITLGTTSPATGTPVVYYAYSGATSKPLKVDKCYYAIKTGASTLRLATSLTKALANEYVNITTTGNAIQQLIWYSVNDYGWTYAGDRGSTIVLNTNAYDPTYAERLIMTAELFAKQDTTSTKAVLNVLQPNLPNRGYFITPKLNSVNIEDTYPTLMMKFKPLDEDESIIVKYRVLDKDPINVTALVAQNSRGGTWTSTTTFTSTLDLSSVEVGDEIEIVAGVGAGHLAHVSTITENSGTYTVTLDEAFMWASNNDLFYFVVTNFKRLETITQDTKTSGRQYAEIPLINASNTGTFVQFKIELRGIDVTISELQVSNKTFKKVV
jgi:hypothetical protein